MYDYLLDMSDKTNTRFFLNCLSQGGYYLCDNGCVLLRVNIVLKVVIEIVEVLFLYVFVYYC